MTSTNNGSHERSAEGGAQAGGHVGTMAEEAALLAEVLSEYAGGWRGEPAGSGTRPDPENGQEPGSPTSEDRTCTCGGTRPAACGVCPVCQLIAFVQRVNPEAIDRLADAVELAATGLRDLATVQRSRRAGSHRGEPS